MTDRRIISTSSAPGAIGPYSQAVIAGGLVYCSGQIALDPATGELIKGDVRAQTERVMENLTEVLKAAGTSFLHSVKCTIFLKSMDDFATVNEVYGRYMPAEDPPARACVEVARLPKSVDVEIDCIASVS